MSEKESDLNARVQSSLSSTDTDQYNLQYVGSDTGVDKINKFFYEKFNYPWPPSSLISINDSSLIGILNQDIGDFTHSRLGGDINIWVAGCGTNQALITALKFPTAQVLGTDISSKSLNICREKAVQIGVKNLDLEVKSINDIDYEDEFDYIICTGVIHHNANPESTLRKLAGALKKDGVLELMVYNYYHRILTTAFQKAIRALLKSDKLFNFDTEVDIAKKLINSFSSLDIMSVFLSDYKDADIARMADALLQPVEYSYTVESLSKLVRDCDLELLLPCVNQFDKASHSYNWNLKFDDPSITAIYENLPDEERWQVTNLLMLHNSPMLWYYVQRQDSEYKRKTEKEVCMDFLKTRFDKLSIDARLYTQTKDGQYKCINDSFSFPNPPAPMEDKIKVIFENVTPEQTMEEVLTGMGEELKFENINDIRLNLTTMAWPYLTACRNKLY